MDRITRALTGRGAYAVEREFADAPAPSRAVLRPGEIDGQAARLAAPRLARVLAHIDANLDARLGLADLAGIAGLSSMHFAATFRRATGLSPRRYVIRRRIQVAMRLLTDTDQPIVDVALSTGFQAQAHFSTVFKRLVGLPPARWRAAMREKSDRIRP